jgi:hypothetical protein
MIAGLIPLSPSMFGGTMLRRFAIMMMALTLFPVFSGCGSDSTTSTGPGPSPADFSGSWTLDLELVEIRTVFGRACANDVGHQFAVDAVVTQNGSTATISFDGGPQVELTVNGSSATGIKPDGEALDIDLTISGGVLGGTIAICGDCTGDTCTEVYSVAGTRTPTGSGGDFAGFWSYTLAWIANPCELKASPDCSEFVQNGDLVTIVNEGIQGTVVGNTLTMQQVLNFNPLTITFDIVLEISGDGNSFTGTNTVTYEDSMNPENDCQSVASMSGTRVTGCGGRGASLLTGIRIP